MNELGLVMADSRPSPTTEPADETDREDSAAAA